MLAGLATHCDLLGVAAMSGVRLTHLWTLLADNLDACDDADVELVNALFQWRFHVQSKLQPELAGLIAFMLPFHEVHEKPEDHLETFGARMTALQHDIEETTAAVMELLSNAQDDDEGDAIDCAGMSDAEVSEMMQGGAAVTLSPEQIERMFKKVAPDGSEFN